jgi:hypothetical protein
MLGPDKKRGNRKLEVLVRDLSDYATSQALRQTRAILIEIPAEFLSERRLPLEEPCTRPKAE